MSGSRSAAHPSSLNPLAALLPDYPLPVGHWRVWLPGVHPRLLREWPRRHAACAHPAREASLRRKDVRGRAGVPPAPPPLPRCPANLPPRPCNLRPTPPCPTHPPPCRSARLCCARRCTTRWVPPPPPAGGSSSAQTAGSMWRSLSCSGAPGATSRWLSGACPHFLPPPQDVLPLFPLDWTKLRGNRRFGATGTRKVCPRPLLLSAAPLALAVRMCRRFGCMLTPAPRGSRPQRPTTWLFPACRTWPPRSTLRRRSEQLPGGCLKALAGSMSGRCPLPALRCASKGARWLCVGPPFQTQHITVPSLPLSI